ncbi:hypothetical protein GCM10029964_127860 [Kibdelosporangium lantanae]
MLSPDTYAHIRLLTVMEIAVDTSPFLTAAMAAAERGWHVFPLRPNTKTPALHGYNRCPRTGACANGHQGWEQRATRVSPHRASMGTRRLQHRAGHWPIRTRRGRPGQCQARRDPAAAVGRGGGR